MREFEILGQKIVISQPEDIDNASLALKLVNEKIEKIKESKPRLNPNQVAVLALLEFAGMLVKDRRSMDEYRKELDDRCTALMDEVSFLIDQKS